MKRPLSSLIAPALLALGLSAGLVACGSDDEPATSGTETPVSDSTDDTTTDDTTTDDTMSDDSMTDDSTTDDTTTDDTMADDSDS